MRTRAAVFLITLSGLGFEVGLTRIYSATIWYHFAFIAISIALLGWGLGGMVVHLLRARWPPSAEKAAGLSIAYGVAIALCLWLLVRFPFELNRLALYFLAPVVPFLLAGMALAMIFHEHRQAAGQLYFADLLGASLGAVAVTFLLQWLGGEGAVLATAVPPMMAAACLAPRVRATALVGALALAAAAWTNPYTGAFKVIPGTSKAMRKDLDANPGARVTQEGSNAYSRISAVEGLPPPFIARLYIDSDAWTSVYPWDGRVTDLPEVKSSYRALPFRLEPNAETLVIGPGGGADVVAALVSGSRRVTACELNPLMLQFVRHYGARAGNLYDRPDVDVVQSEGRNYISRTSRTFDVIFLGFVDSWASVASGGLSLSENYLYTTQAFRAYYDHLTDNGVLVILRWNIDIPRLVANAVALLGPAEAEKRVVVLTERRAGTPTGPAQMLFMLRKQPYPPDQTKTMLSDWTSLARPIIVPGHAVPPYDDLLGGRKTLAQYVNEAPTMAGPVFDDSPFYFATERPWGIASRIAEGLIGWLLAPAALLLLLFVLFGKPAGQPAAPYLTSVVYFACLGFGFIAIELALLQNLTLLVGHPIFTLSVLLFSLLAFGGLGSALSRRVPLALACLAAAIIGAAEAFGLPHLVPWLLPLSLGGRIACAMALVAPLGLAMGMPFPRGLLQTGRGSLPSPPFYWGLNGVMSVIGSVTTVFVAVLVGFRAAMLMGCACYLVAAAASRMAFVKESR